MRDYRLDTQYGVGKLSTAIVQVRDFGLPVPQVVYRPFQQVYGLGDMTRNGDGPPSAEWVFDLAYVEQVGALIRYLFSGVGTQSANVYVRTDMRVGWYERPRDGFATFSAICWRPQLYGPDGGYARDTPYQVDALRLVFKNLQVA